MSKQWNDSQVKIRKSFLARRLAATLLPVAFTAFILLNCPACTNSTEPEGQNHPSSAGAAVDLIVEGAPGSAVIFGIERLAAALEASDRSFNRVSSMEESRSSFVMIAGTPEGSSLIRDWVETGTIKLAEGRESLAVKHLTEKGKNVLCIAGSDERGLMYALLEIAQQIQFLGSGKDWFSSAKDISESPRVPVRSMAILLHNEDCEKDWYYSKEHWQQYFARLATDRWNNFNLIFSHQTAYLSPLYAFHIDVPEHPEVKAIGLSKEQQKKNLEMLRYISRLANERSIDFTLGIWQQIAWEGKNQGSAQVSMVSGLTRQNMHSYIYLALKKLLQEVPNINAVQLRINHESGLDYNEQTEFFKNSVFRAIKDCGRPVLLENRNVGFLRETLQASLDMDIPTRVSHKYWGEHMVFPYHPTRIMWTYSYGDWLKYPQTYENIYQVWSLGSHRLFLWGDPEYVRRFAPTTTFQNASGFEICAPLSQKGIGNAPGAWRIFKDKDREHFTWEFERYWSTYMLFGRLTYNPDTADEIWLRDIRRRFGAEAAPFMAEAYRKASRVIPTIQGQATADYNMYTWPEKDMGGPINFYLHYLSFEEDRLSSFMEYVDRLLQNKLSAKMNPEDSAQRLEILAAECETALKNASRMVDRSNKEFWATAKDFQIISGMARYFSRKIRATYNLGLFYALSDLSLLKKAAANAEEGLVIWKELSATADELYYDDLVMGPGSYGHWKNNIPFVENDLKQIRHQEKLFDIVENFDFGFDFGPKPFNKVTEIYTAWHINAYTIEHRFQGVFPQSLFNPQQGFGWNDEVLLRAKQPRQVSKELWRASNNKNLNVPEEALLSDFVQGTHPAVFRVNLPQGHYQATVIITDRSGKPVDHGPMNVSVIERFGERPILTDTVIKKGDLIVKKFNFNMVGSRYSTFRLQFSAVPGADFIVSGLTFTRIEPHIAHFPLHTARPGQELTFDASVTLPEQILIPSKNSLSIARGTTSTIDPPDKIAGVKFFYSTDGGQSYNSKDMVVREDKIYTAVIPEGEVKKGKIRYFIEARDSIGQTVHLPSRKENDEYFLIQVTDDRTPPVVEHTPAKECSPGEPLLIKSKVTDDSEIKEVILYYRPTRQAMEYSKVTLVPKGKSLYEATIPGEIITTEFDLMYYIEAVDIYGNGIYFPDWNKTDPHIVVKVRR